MHHYTIANSVLGRGGWTRSCERGGLAAHLSPVAVRRLASFVLGLSDIQGLIALSRRDSFDPTDAPTPSSETDSRMWSASKSSLTSTLPGRACTKALVSALCAYGEETGSDLRGERAFGPRLRHPGRERAVIFSNVAQCDHNTRPNSLPSKMWPAVDGASQLPHGRP